MSWSLSLHSFSHWATWEELDQQFQNEHLVNDTELVEKVLGWCGHRVHPKFGNDVAVRARGLILMKLVCKLLHLLNCIYIFTKVYCCITLFTFVLSISKSIARYMWHTGKDQHLKSLDLLCPEAYFSVITCKLQELFLNIRSKNGTFYDTISVFLHSTFMTLL